MHVRIQSPALLVLRLSVTDAAGTHRRSWSMPAAPSGSPAWQLPTVAAHLIRLHRRQTAPTVDGFAAHLTELSGAPIPFPQAPYGYDPLHDGRVSCLIDLHTEPAQGNERWPRCSLMVLEQETGRCAWSRITRRHGAYAVIAYTHTEVTAEAQRLSDRRRSDRSGRTAAMCELAEEVRVWAQRMHRQVKAEQTLIRAGQQQRPQPQPRRSARVVLA
ncbi:hypothetical protein [Streptomyces sp. NPDC051098]|uniref:hypothetical protein n=1 Tax=Streptomyces sp. NPDC051098 TaxID=3155411 RepID=UPI00343594E4